MDTNCWLKRTPLETGLLLILIVSVPFLIAMIAVYCVLLAWHCPKCSMTCKDYCNRTTVSQKSDEVAKVLQLDANLSLLRLAEKYEICSSSELHDPGMKVEHPYVASILEDVYVDSVSDRRYKCAAAIITFKWVFSAAKCVYSENRDYAHVQALFARAGSKYWSNGGSIHKITHVVFAEINPPDMLAASELEDAFPKLPSIRPIMLSRTSLFRDYGAAEMCGWNINERAPLSFRKKYLRMNSKTALIFKDTTCDDEVKNQEHVFCAKILDQTNDTCSNYTGYLAVRGRTLMGISIGEFCIGKEYVAINVVYDISQAIHWLETSIGALVDFA